MAGLDLVVLVPFGRMSETRIVSPMRARSFSKAAGLDHAVGQSRLGDSEMHGVEAQLGERLFAATTFSGSESLSETTKDRPSRSMSRSDERRLTIASS